MVPFFVYVTLFLLLPTLIVVDRRVPDGRRSVRPSTNIAAVLGDEAFREAFVRRSSSPLVTAIVGAILGGLLAWAVATGDPGGRLRQLVVAASGVLAQFGGVMLAFAFLATFGFNGLVTIFLQERPRRRSAGRTAWLYGMTGLAVVYTYFQIPLMVIVFLPALDGLRQEW